MCPKQKVANVNTETILDTVAKNHKELRTECHILIKPSAFQHTTISMSEVALVPADPIAVNPFATICFFTYFFHSEILLANVLVNQTKSRKHVTC